MHERQPADRDAAGLVGILLARGPVEEVSRFALRCPQRGFVAAIQVGSVHHVEMRGMGDGELDVSESDVEEGARFVCCAQRVVEDFVSLGRDRGEQAGLVAEVMRRCGVRRAGAPRQLAHARTRSALLRNLHKRRVQDLPPEIAVVICAGTSH